MTPYGYRCRQEGERLLDPEPNPETAPVVQLAFESYATEQYDGQEIANLLISGGYKPSGRARSGRFTRESIRYILSNAFYVGQVRHGDNLYPGLHEALISKELWDQVQVIRRRGAGKGAGRKPHRVYLLARLARCDNCGLRLTAKTSGGRGRRGYTRYYFCLAHRRSVDCPAAREHVPADLIEGQVADLVMRLRLPDDSRDRLEELANHRDERDTVEAKRQYLQSKLKRLRDLYVEGDYTKADYDRKRADLQSQLAALHVPDRPDVEQAGETLESLGREWASAPKRIQRDMLAVIFEAIYVDVAERRVVCVKPYPQFAPLFRMDGLEEREDGCFYWKEEHEEA